MYGIANIVLQVGINMLGTDSMAGWTAFNKFDDYYWPISNAIGIAVMTYVGQNFGAGDRERVHESIHKGLLIHLTTSALFSVIIFSGRYPMMHLFVGDDPTVIAIGAQVTALIAPCYVLFTLVEVLSSTMRGVGDAGGPRPPSRWSLPASCVSSTSGATPSRTTPTSPLPSSTPSPGCSPASPFSFTISPANGAQGLPSEKAAREPFSGPARNRRLTNFLPVFLVRQPQKAVCSAHQTGTVRAGVGGRAVRARYG